MNAFFLIDLWKVYSYMPHGLFKDRNWSLNCVGQGNLPLLLGYLTHQKQKSKLVPLFCTWSDTDSDVRPGSILVSFAFRTVIKDLFYTIDFTINFTIEKILKI